MSISSIIRPLITVATLTLAGSALAGPAPQTLPMPKQAAKVIRYCEQGAPARGYRDIHARFGTYSESDTRAVPAR
jgi:hypothetical protein